MKRTLLASWIILLLAFQADHALAQVANFSASPLSGCAPQLVLFSNTSTGSISSWNWNFGNGATSVLQNPSTTYVSPGTYTVTLTVSGPGGSNTKTSSNLITIYGGPTVSFSVSNASGCAPHTTQFNTTVTPNAPGAVTYTWNFGDGSTGTGANPYHTYLTPGTYSVTLTATNGQGCSTTLVQSSVVTVHGPPAAGFSSPSTVYCYAPSLVSFNSTGTTGSTVGWDFGDGSTGSGASVSHTYIVSGTYTVRMIVTSATGCADTVLRSAYIKVGGRTSVFSGPSNVCMGIAASFVNTTSGASGSTTWDFGDGKTTTGNAVLHSYTLPGTYFVQMTTNVGGCADTAVRICVVHPRPMAVITSNPILCPAPVSVPFNASASIGAASYKWSWASGGSDTNMATQHFYGSGGRRDTVKLVVVNAVGCKDSVTDSVILRDMIMEIDVDTPEGCIPHTASFRVGLRTTFPDTGKYPSPISSYAWTFGDGASSALDSPTHIYQNQGTYVASVTVTTANGCSMTDTVHIRVGTKVKPSFTITPDTVCPGEHVYCFVNTQDSIPAPWRWSCPNLPKPPNPTDTLMVIEPHISGYHPIILTTNNNGCEDTAMRYITVLPGGASFNHTPDCAPSTDVAFANHSSTATSWLWAFGDGDTSTAFDPSHTYPALGTYVARLTTLSSVSGCRDTAYGPVNLFQPQTAVTASDTVLCLGETVYLRGSFTGARARYAWYVDNVRQNLADTTLHLALQLTRGYHSITLRDTTIDQGCIDSVHKPNYILVSRPVAAFTVAPAIGCAPLPVIFTNTSIFTQGVGMASLKFGFGDGSSAYGNPSTTAHTYAAPGLYTVMLITSDSNGCSDTLVRPALVDARKIVASFGVNKTAACIGEGLSFSGNATGAASVQYKWDFGDGSSSNLKSPVHAYAATGTYTVRLIVSDPLSGCNDTVTKAGLIGITKPSASFTLSDTFSICTPAIIRFASTSTGATAYAWSFGNGNSASLSTPVNTYASPGIFTVMFIAIDASGCRDTAPLRTVQVLGYAGALSYAPKAGCVPLTVHFKAGITNAPSLVWDFSDGVTAPAIGDTISHTYLTPGAYVPKLIFSNGAGCTSASAGLDTIVVDAVKAGFTMSPPCERASIKFTDTSRSVFSPLYKHHWDLGNGELLAGNPVYGVYPAPGVYQISLAIANLRGCTDTLRTSITIRPLPIVRASADTVVCVPDRIMITGEGASSYLWTPAASLSCAACVSPLAFPTLPTAYIVTGTDAYGCTAKDTVVIGIQTKTSFTAVESGEICVGQSYQLFAAGATLYNWTPSASLSNPEIADPIARPTVSTTYVVTGKEGSCAADTHRVQVIVNPLPIVNAGSDGRIVSGDSVQLQAFGTGIDHLLWSADPSLSCSACYAPFASPRITTTYYLTAFTEKGCSATDSVRVYVLCDGSQLFIPNTFTPNGDGMNDYFFARGKGLDNISSFRVYSRWGELLFERSNMQVNNEFLGWNGTCKGRTLSPDVYVYVIEALCDSGEPIRWKGDVTLLR